MTIKKLRDLQTFDEKKMTKQIVIGEEKSKIIVFNFLPGQEMPKHGHPHKNTFVFVIEGEGKCYLDDSDSAIEPGDIIHCNPYQKISIENTGATSMTVYVVLIEE
ncbi:cupin domain-containing protein [Planococcus sp. N028]|uniref:Cupin domain-containing protein n=1 Tax=Planococcus shixiaomingii TaxID=3058393 RepID=A0ABT8MYJ9_9BACL|nr:MULTISPECIES: cupin domain-containing protein [unclassified Planococcus (in: firmicutes)]MDN7240670.1 cupin domain-containing protein [Planococcus sp. N028]WKA56566.1 cupin domain-containing protein [Planococcus sp. N022]